MPDSSVIEVVLAVLVGVGLSAASGFRVFVPLLVMSIFAYTGKLDLSGGFQWIGSWQALVAFAVAALAEVLAYSIPWVDNALDHIAGPLAVGAGVMMMFSVLPQDISPLVKWSLAIIAGGGAAGLTQGMTTIARAGSTVLTGGLGNFVIAALEFVASVVVAVLAIFWPLVAVAAVLVMGALAVWIYRKRKPKPSAQPSF